MHRGDNITRRAWYLSGFFHGVLRLESAENALRRLDELDAEDRERLRTAPCPAGSLLAGELIRRYLAVGRPTDAVEWIREHLTVIATRVVGPILAWSREAIVRGDAEAVRQVLHAVRERLPDIDQAVGPVPVPLERELRRRFATALRLTGDSSGARRIVESLLEECEDESERAYLLSDRALLDLGIRSLESIDLGSPEIREALVASILKNRSRLEKAIDLPIHMPVPPLLLALPAILRPGCGEEERETALTRLQQALACLRNELFWRRTGVLQLIKFGQSLLELRSLRDDLAPAANRLAEVLEDATFEPPVDLVAEALDELETLAAEGQEERLLELLEDESRWDPAWTRRECGEAKIRLLEASGRLEQAAGALVGLIHRTITEGGDAEDLLDRLGSLPVDERQVDDLRRRVEATAEEATPAGAEGETVAPSPVRVLFVGGNETQQAYQGQLEEWLQESHPGCTVDFEFSGWTSNWGQILERLDTRLEKADSLVLMRFMRTMLGRALRREADRYGLPWVPCSGHGRASLQRAIGKAISVGRASRKTGRRAAGDRG